MAAHQASRPWDSPGKNTRVGYHFLLQCMKVKSKREVAQSCLTLATPWTAVYQAPPYMGFSRQKYWSGVPLPSPPSEHRQNENHNHRKLSKLTTWTTALSNSMKLLAMPCRATKDRRVMVESSDKMWPTREGNGKPLQYSCFENLMNSMKRQKDMTLKD